MTDNEEEPMPILSARVNLHKRYTAAQHVARQQAAMNALRRIYCDVVGLWRSCAVRRCKRHRRCCGDAWSCLQRGRVPASLRARIHEQVRTGGPDRLPPVNSVERKMRDDPPAGWL